jgi:protein-disulfide isomerase
LRALAAVALRTSPITEDSVTVEAQVPSSVPAAASPEGDGIVVGDGPVRVDAFIDFLCPFCRQFEEASGPALDRMVEQGAIRWVNHPLSFLDRLSTTRYSSRASAASGCAADDGRFRDYARSLFAHQPPEGGPGLSDEQLVELGHALGLSSVFERCVSRGVYLPWTAYVTRRAMEGGVSGTPSVFVEGAAVPANARMIATAVAAVTA